MNMQPRFFARGNAVAFAGRVTRLGDRQVDQVIDIAGNSSSLPVTGGLSRSETGQVTVLHDHTWPAPIVSLRSGSTRSWDEGDATERVTHVMAAIEDLAIAGRFFIGHAAAYLRSKYRRGADEPDITLGDCAIAAMRCDEHPLEVRWRTKPVNAAPTYAALTKAWARSKGGDALDQAVIRPPAVKRHDPKTLPAMKDHVLVTICELAWAGEPHPEVTLDGNTLHWPGFGRVYFGEMLIAHHVRRLTLVRFELGSPFAMSATAIEVESDGIGLP
jgi:hypothetical protein